MRIIKADDNDTYADSGLFSIVGSFNVTSPVTNDSWIVDSTQDINWTPTGSSIIEAYITYSVNGTGGPWYNISETWNNSDDGIVDNNGTFAWVIPDNISSDAFIRIADPDDPTVNDTSGQFKIVGSFSLSSPTNTSRWVYKQNNTISWNTTGSIGKVNISYSDDNFTTTKLTVIDNKTNTIGSNIHVWQIPDPVVAFSLNSSDDLPVQVRVRIEDYNDSSIYVDSELFNLDYYNVTWYIRDSLSFLPISGNLSVNCTSGWIESQLASPLVHKTPFGSWKAYWEHEDYGGATANYVVDNDITEYVSLESKVVHVWEAASDYVYDTATDTLNFNSYLMRDGIMAGGIDENGTFFTLAKNCTILLYYPNGTLLNTSLYSDNKTEAGFFSIEWNNTALDTSIVYNAMTQIMTMPEGNDTNTSATFRTPFQLNLVPTVSLYNATKRVTDYIDVPLSVFQANMTGIMENQTLTIETKMNQTVSIIENKTDEMMLSVNTTLLSFENRTYAAIADLQAGANQTLNASEIATLAAADLQATAVKYSWGASVAPNPVLSGENVTLQVQGPSGYLPLVSIYSWDNIALVQSQFLMESTTAGVYNYAFEADNTFDVGKAYTYIVSESVTGGLVSGSGMVESMSITSIAGLASAAPGAESAAKKALEAIKAVEAVLVSGEDINIGLTLRNLSDQVEELPEVLSREGPSAKVFEALNGISERLKILAGDEGFDLEKMFEEALGESPTIREIRKKTETIQAVIKLLQMLFEAKLGGLEDPFISTSLHSGSIIFRITAINPSKTQTKTTSVKVNLPLEVRPKDIMDLGGLDLEYDPEKAIYYVYKSELELGPAEVRFFEVEVEDIWMVPEEKLSNFKKHTDSILTYLEETDYYDQGKDIADTIYARLEQIRSLQMDDTLSQQQHIGMYRQNLITIEKIKEDIAKMEKILVTAGGPLAPEMLADKEITSEAPSETMTWLVIFIIIIFIALLAGILFFTWQRQSGLTKGEILASKRSAFKESVSKEEETP
jgi:hypothetical protein